MFRHSELQALVRERRKRETSQEDQVDRLSATPRGASTVGSERQDAGPNEVDEADNDDEAEYLAFIKRESIWLARAREGQRHDDLYLQYDDGEKGENEDRRKIDDDDKSSGMTSTKPYQPQDEEPGRLQTYRKRIVYSDENEIETGLVTNTPMMVDQSIKQTKQKREFLWPRIGGP